MAKYVAEAQKERETWLLTQLDSNSNQPSSQAAHVAHAEDNSAQRPEKISDDIRLLCHKIKENPELDPLEDKV